MVRTVPPSRPFAPAYVHHADDVSADRGESAGATVVKPAEAAQWGGYFGYFADPDGNLWKVAANS